MTGSLHLFGGDARQLADDIRGRLRQELGLSATACKYAVMAASGVENKDICRLFSVSEDSVKSSLNCRIILF